MCIRSGLVGQVSYRDSGVSCRRRHSYSGISMLRIPLVFVVAHCLVSVLSSVLRVIFVFGIPSVFVFVVIRIVSAVRVRCVVIVRVVRLFRSWLRRFSVRAFSRLVV